MQRLGLGALLSAALLGLFRFLILSFIATQAAATDFTAPLLNEEGKPFSICRKYDFPGIATGAPTGPKQCVEEVPLSIGQTIFDALNQPEKSLTNDGIVSRGLLALKVREAKDLELTASERDAVKAAMFSALQSLGYKPVAIVQVLKVIDPAAVK